METSIRMPLPHNESAFNGQPGTEPRWNPRTAPPGRSVAVESEDRSAGPVQCREPMQSRSRSGRIGGGSLPQEDCMGLRRIIALDLGKFKTVACVMNVADRSHVFETLEMSPQAVHELLARHATEDRRDTR